MKRTPLHLRRQNRGLTHSLVTRQTRAEQCTAVLCYSYAFSYEVDWHHGCDVPLSRTYGSLRATVKMNCFAQRKLEHVAIVDENRDYYRLRYARANPA